MEMAEWRASTGKFAYNTKRFAWETLATTNVDAITWWKSFFKETTISQIFEALDCVPFTSASNERSWSIRKNIHTPIRNRYVYCKILDPLQI